MRHYSDLVRELSRVRRQWLLDGMRECGGCVRKFSERAGVNRTQLYKLLQKYAPDAPRTCLPISERKSREHDREFPARGGNGAWRALNRHSEART